MPLLRTKRDTLAIIFFTTLFIVTVIYGASRAYPLITGAKLTITYPHDGDTVASSTFQVIGNVIRAKEIRIQGEPISIDTDGNFSETVVATKPYTFVVIEVHDKYDNTITKTLRVLPE